MSRFFNDLIHLTRLEFAIKYWWLILLIIILGIILTHFQYKNKLKEINERYDKLDSLFKNNKGD